jgi:hypothetical protein
MGTVYRGFSGLESNIFQGTKTLRFHQGPIRLPDSAACIAVLVLPNNFLPAEEEEKAQRNSLRDDTLVCSSSSSFAVSSTSVFLPRKLQVLSAQRPLNARPGWKIVRQMEAMMIIGPSNTEDAAGKDREGRDEETCEKLGTSQR